MERAEPDIRFVEKSATTLDASRNEHATWVVVAVRHPEVPFHCALPALRRSRSVDRESCGARAPFRVWVEW